MLPGFRIRRQRGGDPGRRAPGHSGRRTRRTP